LSGGGHNAFGYPYYRTLASIPKELEGIDPDVWAGFFVQVSGIEARNNGKECIYVLILLAGLVVCLVVAKITGNMIIAVAALLVVEICLFCVLSKSQAMKQKTLADLCQEYAPKFAASGWKVSCHVEMTPPSRKFGPLPVHVAHFLPLSTS